MKVTLKKDKYMAKEDLSFGMVHTMRATGTWEINAELENISIDMPHIIFLQKKVEYVCTEC